MARYDSLTQPMIETWSGEYLWDACESFPVVVDGVAR